MEESQSGVLHGIIDFVLSVDRLKEVRRQNPLANGSRRERTAEHCWHVAIAAICLQSFAAEPLDVSRAVQLAVVHDLPEVIVGDTFAYGASIASRREREQAGLAVLLAGLSVPLSTSILDNWTEYEYEKTPEGRYVMAIDVLLPIFINFAAGHASSWRRHRVTAQAVFARIDKVQGTVPELTKLARATVEQAIQQGLLQS